MQGRFTVPGFEDVYTEYAIFVHLDFSSMYTSNKYNATKKHSMANSFVPGSAMVMLYMAFHSSHLQGRTTAVRRVLGFPRITQLVSVRGGI